MVSPTSLLRIAGLMSILGSGASFSLAVPAARRTSTALRDGQIEQIEFKIYPDGRVEETVRGVKGANCHEVTAKINENLGKVVASEPTEEMYEQEIVIDQTLTETVGGGTGEGGDSWEGQSSW